MVVLFVFSDSDERDKGGCIEFYTPLPSHTRVKVVLCFIEHQESDIGDLYTVRGFLFLGPQIVSCAP